MKLTILICSILAAFCIAATAKQSSTKLNEAKATQAQADSPGPMHQQLARRAGTYITVNRFRLKPDGQAIETKGTAKLTGALGGRFLVEENTGMQLGQPIEGRRMYGYNNATRQFEACWTYSASTAILTLAGASSGQG
jgi:hypothetical protein